MANVAPDAALCSNDWRPCRASNGHCSTTCDKYGIHGKHGRYWVHGSTTATHGLKDGKNQTVADRWGDSAFGVTNGMANWVSNHGSHFGFDSQYGTVLRSTGRSGVGGVRARRVSVNLL